MIVTYNKKTIGIELKSFSDHSTFQRALTQAARYGKQLGLPEIYLVTFVESVDRKNKQEYESPYTDSPTGVNVLPIPIQTGRL